MKFYTNVACVGSHIYYRGVKDGRRVREKIEYEPTLYTKSADLNSPFRTLHGEPLEPKRFNSIYDARDFVKTYEDVVGFTIYGNSRYEYAYIAEEHPEELIEWNPEKIVIAYLDIEVGSENGFPKPEDAQEELTAITVKLSTSPDYFVFGCGEFTSTDSTVQYIRCVDEDDLIRNFLAFWKEADPDVVSGWSIKTFDIPYLVNRLKRLYGDATANRLSPWGRIYEKQEHLYNREMITYDLVGISILDYLQLFRKFSPNASQESYRLDYIASVELKKKKLSYADYDSLHDLYKKNYQLFIEYNIQDVRLVEELNAKGGLIDMALTLAYDNKTNFDDVFSQVLMWDCICYNFLLRDNIIVPPKVHRSKDKAYEGAYVKDPQIGFFKWVASLDLNSLYPHLMMQYNLSPETLVEPDEYSTTLRDILVAAPAHSLVEPLLTKSIDLAMLRENGVTMTPNGQFFRISKQGFLPKIMQKMYNDRVGYKKKMIESKKLYEKETDPETRKKLEFLISRYKNLQLAKKVSLNSAYGACGNEHFRFFDIRIAEAVTLAGQLSIRWIENALNRYMNGLLKTEKKDYIIASDTDSVYLHLAPLIDKVFPPGTATIKIIDAMDTICREKLTPFITQQYGELALYMNAYEQKMEMKRESLVDTAIWTAKKRYILNVYDEEGVRFAEPQMKIQGLEAIKSSTPSACRVKIKEALKLIIKGDQPALHEFIAQFRSEFKRQSPEDIAFPRSVNGLTKYRSGAYHTLEGEEVDESKGASKTPIHVKASMVYNAAIKRRELDKLYPKIQEGEKIKFVYLQMPNQFHSPVIAFTNRAPRELQIESCIDYNKQFEKSFLDPLKIILESIEWTTEKAACLEDFFA